MHKYFISASLFIACSAGYSSESIAQQNTASSYPDKPVTIIVANLAAGTMGLEGRIYGHKLGERFGKPFVVDYKAGAGGSIGAAHVAKAVPDGYTLLFASTSFSVVPAFNEKLSYDPIKSFSPVSLISLRPNVLLVHPAFPAKNMKEYIDFAKANPGKINFGTSGNGGAQHLSGAWLHGMTNTEVAFVHYKGSGAVIPDLISGRVDAFPAPLITAIPHIRSGKLRAIAVLSPNRSSLLPDVKTAIEEGISNFNVSSWAGFMATGGTSTDIVNKLSTELEIIAKDPDVAKVMEAGTVMVGSKPAQFAQLINDEVSRWRELVKKLGIKQD